MAGSNGYLGISGASVQMSVDTNPPVGTVSAFIAGTFSATITFEASNDINSTTGSANWFVVGAIPVSSTTGMATGLPTTTTTTTGTWVVPNNGYAQIRARVSAYTSGSAYVSMDGSSTELAIPVPFGDSFQVGGKATAPTIGVAIASGTPTVGTWEFTVNAFMSQGTPATGDALNMELRVGASVKTPLAVPGASGPSGPFGPFRFTVDGATTVSVNATGGATASVVYGATIAGRRVA